MESDETSTRRANLSDKKKALLEARLKGRKGKSRGGEGQIPKLAGGAPAPLSLAQERLWILHQLEPESTAYNVPAAFRIRGALQPDALAGALNDLVARHEVLRTTLQAEGDHQFQQVAAVASLKLDRHDFSADVDGERDAKLAALLAKQAEQLFLLSEGPLIRFSLIKLSEDEHVLSAMAHHAVTDGWSLGVVLRDLSFAYGARCAGEEPAFEPLAVQYGDYAAWQRSWLEGAELERQINYWKERLGGELPVLQLPLDKARPPIRSHHGALRQKLLPAALLPKLEAIAQAQGATLFMVLLAAYDVLLSRYSGQQDVIVGVPIANRTRKETEAMVGFFANTLAMRNDLSGDPTFTELLGRVRDGALEAYDHQDIPFQRLVEVIQPSRDMSRTPVYQTLFSYMDKAMNADAEVAGSRWRRERIDANIAQTDLVFYVEERDDGLLGAVEYGSDLFLPETIDRMLANFEVLLKSIAEAPDRPISQLEVLSEAERALVLSRFNDTDREYDRGLCMHQAFELQVEHTPDAVALVYQAETLSYRQLDERANQVAQRLAKLGVTRGDMVGLCLERCTEMVVGLLGILKAGAAYVPLDPNYPHDRLVYMVEDCGAQVVVTHAEGAEFLGIQGIHYLKLDEEAETLAAESTGRVDSGVTSSDLGYVIYTSGSTGKPKGVMVEHRNAGNFFAGMDERVLKPEGEQGSWLAVTSISFDISVLEIFWSLSRGLKLVMYGADDRRSAAKQALGGRRSRHADKHIDFSLFYFASDESEFAKDKYRVLLEGAKFADKNGFQAVWTPERHFHPFGGLYPSPAVASAAIAVLTENVKIRAGSVVATLDHYIRIAEEWQLVDNLSNGRVGISFAPGWQPNDFVLAPQNYEKRRDVMYDSMDKIRRLWRGEQLTLDGGDGKPFTFGTLPRPVQAELPFWVTAAGDPKTFAAAGELGANMLTHLLGQTADELKEKIAAYRKARKDAGHEGPGQVTLMLHTFVSDDEDYCRRTVEGPFKSYLRGSVGLFKPFAETMGLDVNNLSDEDLEALIDHAFNRYYTSNGLFGTPDSCMEMVDQLKEVGIDEIACLIDFGIASDDVLGSLSQLNKLRQGAKKRDVSQPAAEGDYSVPGLIKAQQVTHLQCTPSMASMMVSDTEERASLGAIKQWMVGGEAFPVPLAQQLRDVLGPDGRITNMYGPTETTIWSTTHEVSGDETSIPLGTPIANTSIYILDASLSPVPVGVAGELVIGGEGVVRGYLGRDELTRERFVPDTFRGGDARMYRTGDLARFRSDGTLEFLGRNDFQVKIRGYRIELGEIESRMLSHDGVKEAVVVLREDTPGDKRLVGYVVPNVPDGVCTDALRAHLTEALTDYMVPSNFVVLDSFPLTPNKKVDRNALPAPAGAPAAASSNFVAADTPVQQMIAEIWGGVLRVDEVGIHDNFFDLGGHSLLIVHVLNQLRGRGLKLAMTDLFRFPTIAGLSDFLAQDGDIPSEAAEQGTSRAAARRARQSPAAAAPAPAATRRRRR